MPHLHTCVLHNVRKTEGTVTGDKIFFDKTNKKEVFAYPERYTERNDGADEYIVL